MHIYAYIRIQYIPPGVRPRKRFKEAHIVWEDRCKRKYRIGKTLEYYVIRNTGAIVSSKEYWHEAPIIELPPDLFDSIYGKLIPCSESELAACSTLIYYDLMRMNCYRFTVPCGREFLEEARRAFFIANEPLLLSSEERYDHDL